ncbi:MAG: hypothetical protein JNL32_04755 [Candidatus Kapabacteria bacterium]|nr:hypothetical protein [Candidatus Kapabacteria bacterium]
MENWLAKLAERVDLNALSDAENNELKEFVAQFTLRFIPLKKDTEQQKKMKADYIRNHLSSIKRILD